MKIIKSSYSNFWNSEEYLFSKKKILAKPQFFKFEFFSEFFTILKRL